MGMGLCPTRASRPAKNKIQAPVAQTLESAIQRINHSSVDKYKVTNSGIHWIEIFRVDTVNANVTAATQLIPW